MNLTQFHLYLSALPRVVGIAQIRHNTRSQATVRKAVRRRSNLPKAMQRRLGFKCH